MKYDNESIEEEFYDSEDDIKIHEIINNSTQNKRSADHPFTAKSIKKVSPVKTKKQIFLYNISVYFQNRIKDKIIGLGEKRRHKKGKGFSKRALNEFLFYYKDLYHEKSPDIKALHKLLIRNGTPDMANPYSEGNDDYYSYHPLGFIVADLEVILEGMTHSMQETENEFENIEKLQDKVRHRDEKTWLTVSEFIEDDEKDAKDKKEKNQHLALQSWAMILALGDSLEYLKKEVHIDNIEIATIETILIVKISELPSSINLERIVAGAIKLGILNEKFALSVLKQRQEIDEGKKVSNKDTHSVNENPQGLKEQIIINNIAIKPIHELDMNKIKKEK